MFPPLSSSNRRDLPPKSTSHRRSRKLVPRRTVMKRSSPSTQATLKSIYGPIIEDVQKSLELHTRSRSRPSSQGCSPRGSQDEDFPGSSAPLSHLVLTPPQIAPMQKQMPGSAGNVRRLRPMTQHKEMEGKVGCSTTSDTPMNENWDKLKEIVNKTPCFVRLDKLDDSVNVPHCVRKKRNEKRRKIILDFITSSSDSDNDADPDSAPAPPYHSTPILQQKRSRLDYRTYEHATNSNGILPSHKESDLLGTSRSMNTLQSNKAVRPDRKRLFTFLAESSDEDDEDDRQIGNKKVDPSLSHCPIQGHGDIDKRPDVDREGANEFGSPVHIIPLTEAMIEEVRRHFPLPSDDSDVVTKFMLTIQHGRGHLSQEKV